MLKGYEDGVEVINWINQHRRYLEGRVLTIVDASIADPEQRKAVKDLVKESIWSKEDGWIKSAINVLEGRPPYQNNSTDGNENI